MARVNIKDVANLAGVSPGTVSRTLNGNSYVSQETRAKILAAVEELNYKPNLAAKMLKAGRSHTLALVIPSIQNPIFPHVTQGVEDVANMYGYTTILCNTNEDTNREKQYISNLLARSIDGFIFATMTEKSDYIYELRQKGVPVVLVNRRNDDEIDAVQIDNFQATFDATNYLVSTGHRTIAFAMGNESVNVYRDRREGYLAALRHHGIRFYSEWLMQETYGPESFYALTKSLMLSEHRPTAILAGSDIKAFTIMRSLHDNGYKIPEDVSVVGIDNIPMSALVEPPLSSVSQPLYQMGSLAAKKLISQIEHKEETGKLLPPVVDIMTTELIIRKSAR